MPSFEEFCDTAVDMDFSGVELYNIHSNFFTEKGGAFHGYASAATMRMLYERKLTIPCIDMMIDIGARDKKGNRLKKARISMGDREMTPDQIGQRVRDKFKKIGEFPVMIRADYECPHAAVAAVMNACTANGIWKISFVAVGEDKTSKPGNPGRKHLHALKNRTK